ncbi:MAG: LuxR C-terminal-related transcriptional regulator [Solirubrobacterales bacterium]
MRAGMTSIDEAKWTMVEGLTGIGTWEWQTSPERVSFSDQLFRLFGYEPEAIETSIELALDRTHAADREAFREVIAQQREAPRRRSHIGRITRRDGEVRTVLLIVGAVIASEGEGEAPTLIGTVEDITERQLSEQELAAHRAVSEALADWDMSEGRGFAELLGTLGRALDWTVGALWVPDPDAGTLACTAFWSAPDVDASELEAASKSLRFPAAMLAPGRAWMTAAPVIVDDLAQEEEFLLRDPATRAGLARWVAFPLRHRTETLAVAEFYGPGSRPSAEPLRATLESIGRQIGLFFGARRADLLGGRGLTNRERQILQLTADGLSAAEIARRLSVKPGTVKSHFRNIYEKLGVSTRAAAVAEEMRLGLIR